MPYSHTLSVWEWICMDFSRLGDITTKHPPSSPGLRLLLASQRPATDPWSSLAAEMKRSSQSRAGAAAAEWPEAAGGGGVFVSGGLVKP